MGEKLETNQGAPITEEIFFSRLVSLSEFLGFLLFQAYIVFWIWLENFQVLLPLVLLLLSMDSLIALAFYFFVGKKRRLNPAVIVTNKGFRIPMSSSGKETLLTWDQVKEIYFGMRAVQLTSKNNEISFVSMRKNEVRRFITLVQSLPHQIVTTRRMFSISTVSMLHLLKNYSQIAVLNILAFIFIGFSSTGRIEMINIASEFGNNRAVSLMLLLGADINGGEEGRRPLFLAVENNQVETVGLLLRRGANFNIKNNQNETPLALAEKKHFSHISSLLRSSGESL